MFALTLSLKVRIWFTQFDLSLRRQYQTQKYLSIKWIQQWYDLRILYLFYVHDIRSETSQLQRSDQKLTQ